MGHFADVSQLLEVAENVGGCEEQVTALINSFDALAGSVASKLGVEVDNAVNDVGGTLVSFRPKFDGQECPDILIAADPHSEWVAG